MPYQKPLLPARCTPGTRRTRCPHCGMLTRLVDRQGELLPEALQPPCWGCQRGKPRPLGPLERPYFRPTFTDRRPLKRPDSNGPG